MAHVFYFLVVGMEEWETSRARLAPNHCIGGSGRGSPGGLGEGGCLHVRQGSQRFSMRE